MLISLVLNAGLFHKWELGEITTSISARIQPSPSSFFSDVIRTAHPCACACVNACAYLKQTCEPALTNKRRAGISRLGDVNLVKWSSYTDQLKSGKLLTGSISVLGKGFLDC